MKALAILTVCACALILTSRPEAQFPNLGDHEVIAPASTQYNCIAWSLGVTDRWLWPDDGTLEATDELNGQYGYRRLATLDLTPGDKVLVYGRDGIVRHQCRMIDGRWTSKMGADRVIAFDDPWALAGEQYGEPIAVYSR